MTTASTAITGTCHCGRVRLTLPRVPATLTNCNCSTCRRHGALWAYFPEDEVRIEVAPDGLDTYAWGDRDLQFLRCAHCGNVTHWESLHPREDGAPPRRMGVNGRMFDPVMLGEVRIRRLDGADTWEFVE